MHITIENIILIGSILLFLSIIAGKTTYKFGIPTLLLFLSIGMLAGSDGIGGIHFNDPAFARFIGVVSLNFILFSGGLDTKWSSVKPVLKEGIVLSSLGVFLTAALLGLFIWWVTDFSLFESFSGLHCILHRCRSGLLHTKRQKTIFKKQHPAHPGTRKRK